MELNQQKNWVNKLQFRREAKKRWGMNKAQAKAKWQDFLADPKMPKGRDQMNWVTMPCLHHVQCEPQQEHHRDAELRCGHHIHSCSQDQRGAQSEAHASHEEDRDQERHRR